VEDFETLSEKLARVTNECERLRDENLRLSDLLNQQTPLSKESPIVAAQACSEPRRVTGSSALPDSLVFLARAGYDGIEEGDSAYSDEISGHRCREGGRNIAVASTLRRYSSMFTRLRFGPESMSSADSRDCGPYT
jgi:hypothetical protein